MDAASYKKIESSIPSAPGIYRFSDENKKLLYVGKAKNLKKRISSYFGSKKHESNKTRLLVAKTLDVECTVVESEQDALLLENSLIKEFQPRYNIQLKDDKSYPYICIKNERFPRVFLTRSQPDDGSEYLGPYTSVKRVRSILKFIVQMFPLRNCNYRLSEQNIEQGKFKLCLEYHMGNCMGPCEGLQGEEDYGESLEQIRRILKGNFKPVLKYLKEKQKLLVSELAFEKANDTKEKIELLQDYQSKSMVVNNKIQETDVFSFLEDGNTAYVNYLKIGNGAVIQVYTLEIKKKLEESPEELLVFAIHELRQKFKSEAKQILVPFKIDYPDTEVKTIVPQKGDKKKLIGLSLKNGLAYKMQKLHIAPAEERMNKILEGLQQDFHLTELPKHIECFDNSNLQGSNPVASVVVFKMGKPSKKEYRHFNIKTVSGIDDFASMEEVVFRRYRRFKTENLPLPDLILIDGGKGQLNAAINSLKKLELYGKTTIASIAKRLEEIYVPNDPIPMHLDKRSPSLKLIQQVRNEAHRFAINFHRQKRSKSSLKTTLSSIQGIGPGTEKKLLQKFKSLKKVKEASSAELNKVIGGQKTRLILAYFKKH